MGNSQNCRGTDRGDAAAGYIDPNLVAEFTESSLFKDQLKTNDTEKPRLVVEAEGNARLNLWGMGSKRPAKSENIPEDDVKPTGLAWEEIPVEAEAPTSGSVPIPSQRPLNQKPGKFALGHSQYIAGLKLLKNVNGDAKSKLKATKFFKSASALGHPYAMACLGNCYVCGVGDCRKSAAMARHWYQKAARYNIGQAQYNLSVCMIRAGNCDKREVYEWLFKAACNSHTHAMKCIVNHFAAQLREDSFNQKRRLVTIQIGRRGASPGGEFAPDFDLSLLPNKSPQHPQMSISVST